jgi:hypothetical protein
MLTRDPTSLSAVRALDDIPAHPVQYFCPIDMRAPNLSWHPAVQVCRLSKVTTAPKASMDWPEGTVGCSPLCWTIGVNGKGPLPRFGQALLWKESAPALATTNAGLSYKRSVVSGGFPTAEAVVGWPALSPNEKYDPYRRLAASRTLLTFPAVTATTS